MIGDSNRNRDYSKTRVRARKAREKIGSGSVNLRSRQATLRDCDNANAHDSTCNKLASVFASGELAIRDSVEQTHRPREFFGRHQCLYIYNLMKLMMAN